MANTAKKKDNNNKADDLLLNALMGALSKDEVRTVDGTIFEPMVKEAFQRLDQAMNGEPVLIIRSVADVAEEEQKTVITLLSQDRPFLIDSLVAAINEAGHRLSRIVHPSLMMKSESTKDSPDLATYSITEQVGVDVSNVSLIYAETDNLLLSNQVKELQARLIQVVEDVDLTTSDWKGMLAKLRDVRDYLHHSPTMHALYPPKEYEDFLQYLHDDSFTFLGYRQYRFEKQKNGLRAVKDKESGLGLLSDSRNGEFLDEDGALFPNDIEKYVQETDIVTISKIQKNATVHRCVPIDAIIIKRFDDSGQIIGEDVFLGLFTSITYSRSVFDIPLLRKKVQSVLDDCGYKERTHNYRALTHILEKYPRDEIFQIRQERLSQYAQSILDLQECQRIAMYPRIDIYGRYVSCLVYVPRNVFDTKLRQIFTGVLEEAFDGKVSTFYTMMDDSPLVRVLFIVLTQDSHKKKHDFAAIEGRLREEGQDWQERFSVCLRHMGNDARRIQSDLERYKDAFSVTYKDNYKAYQAVRDIEFINKIIDEGSELCIDLYKTEDLAENQMQLKLYHPENPVALSDILPILQNMGFRIISEQPQTVAPKDYDHKVWVHDLLMETNNNNDKPIVIEEIKETFEEALLKLWRKEMEDDSLNTLSVQAGLNWRQISLLRAYTHYMRQIRYSHGQALIRRALNTYPHIAQALVRLFDARHNPDKAVKDRKVEAAGCMVEFDHYLEAVESLEYDRVFRTMASIVQETLRTNFYQKDEEGQHKSYISLKIRSSKLSEVPSPKPWAEIFVYAPEMEGVHLRGGPVARGGLRWSDRQEDFRTEVLGLMKAQVVKNGVIVPTGSKGGFVLKNLPAGLSRDEKQARGVGAYKTFIRGLLDITDNIDDKGKIVPPKSVNRPDGDDPYLVVAADKGTATFSDIANGIAAEYDFWLGDAFASGGSAGYDHKKMGITARGAWEAVKRHFRELGHDTQSEDFDVVGIGDMGGDVFGNGMLLSKHIRLIAAFNHMHIFVDPDPNAQTSWKERKRLFDEVKGWGDYDKRYLSKGGMIFSRSDKTLTLTSEIKKRFNISEDKLSPPELIRKILQSQADLLWFGGIGTYIKDRDESHEDVSDKGNDSLRINAQDFRMKVIGEGANLGLTQKARIAMALNGVKVNTDFIDNSAGVNSSDQEVNIKILLKSGMNAKTSAALKKRNTLLEEMTEDVAQACLRNNYQQTQALSLLEMDAGSNFTFYMNMIEVFEEQIGLDRTLETLPDIDEAQDRMRKDQPLTRPELAVLLCYSKIVFYNALLESEIPDMDSNNNWLFNYFPEKLRDKYKKDILNHRLRREIIATQITNSVLNRLGPVFIYRCMDRTGANVADVVRAYLIVRHMFDLPGLWESVEATDNKVPAKAQLEGFKDISSLVEYTMMWFLDRPHLMKDCDATMSFYADGFQQLFKVLLKILPRDLQASLEKRTKAYEKEGFTLTLARKLAMMQNLVAAPDIIKIYKKTPLDIQGAAELYYAIGSRFSLVWLRNTARSLSSGGHWEEEALYGIIDQFFMTQTNIAMRCMNATRASRSDKTDGNGQEAFESWVSANEFGIRQYDSLVKDIKKQGDISLSMLITAEQRLRALLA